jgi:hypothetical protein
VQRLGFSQDDFKCCSIEPRLERDVGHLALNLKFALSLVSMVQELLREALLKTIG